MSMFPIRVVQPFWKYYQHSFTISPELVKLHSCFQKPMFYSWCYCYTDQRSVGRHQEHSLVHTSWLATHGLRLHPVHSHAFGRTRSAPHLHTHHYFPWPVNTRLRVYCLRLSACCLEKRTCVTVLRYRILLNFSIIDRGAYLLSNIIKIVYSPRKLHLFSFAVST